MKKYFSLAFLLLTTTIVFSQETPQINWMTWEQAMAQHQADMTAYNNAEGKEKVPPKKIFMDMYTSWCGWCKRMDATTFMDPAVVAYMNKYYYAVKFDAERSEPINFNDHEFINPNPGKSRSTHQFAASILDYQLSYPSYVILDENKMRTVIYKGYKQPEDLLGILLYFGTNQHVSYKKQVEQVIKNSAKAPAGN